MKNKPATTADYQRRINIVVEYIRTHLDETLDLRTLAEVSSFSPCHFHRIVSAFLGEPPGEFIARTRIETAARLLLYSDLTVAEIAYRVGYDAPSSLTKAFGRFFGISPKEYRTAKKARWPSAPWASRRSPQAAMRCSSIRVLMPDWAAPITKSFGSGCPEAAANCVTAPVSNATAIIPTGCRRKS